MAVMNVDIFPLLINGTDSSELRARIADHLKVTKPITWLSVVQLAAGAVILLLICALNGVVLYYSLRYKNLRRRVSSLMISLASSDLLVGLVCIPLHMMDTLLKYWVLGPIACKVLKSVEGYVMTINAVTLVSMAAIRLRRSLSATARSELSDRCLLLWVACIWLASAALCSPIALVYSVTRVQITFPTVAEGNSTAVYFHCHESGRLSLAQLYCYRLLPPLLHCILPAAFIAFCYCHIAVVIAGQAGRGGEQVPMVQLPTETTQQCSAKLQSGRQQRCSVLAAAGGHNSARVHKRAITIVVALIVSFVVCSLPKHVINLALDFRPGQQQRQQQQLLQLQPDPRLQTVLGGLLPAAHLFMYLHTVLSPILYWYYNTTFRSYVRRTVANCRR